MKKFNEDPVRYFRYLIGEEFNADNNITLNLSANNYLSFEKPFTDQLPQLEQVGCFSLTVTKFDEFKIWFYIYR